MSIVLILTQDRTRHICSPPFEGLVLCLPSIRKMFKLHYPISDWILSELFGGKGISPSHKQVGITGRIASSNVRRLLQHRMVCIGGRHGRSYEFKKRRALCKAGTGSILEKFRQHHAVNGRRKGSQGPDRLFLAYKELTHSNQCTPSPLCLPLHNVP